MGKNLKSKKSVNRVNVDGPWLPLPIEFLKSRAFAQLSPHAAKLLLDLTSQLGPNARGNGDVCAAPSILSLRGWTSTATLSAARNELLDARILQVTRYGNRRKCMLYAITLWSADCDASKLDPGSTRYTQRDWYEDDQSLRQAPNAQQPAKWSRVRKSPPGAGGPALELTPPRKSRRVIGPAAGAMAGVTKPASSPAAGHLFRVPSTGATATQLDAAKALPVANARARHDDLDPIAIACESQAIDASTHRPDPTQDLRPDAPKATWAASWSTAAPMCAQASTVILHRAGVFGVRK